LTINTTADIAESILFPTFQPSAGAIVNGKNKLIQQAIHIYTTVQ